MSAASTSVQAAPTTRKAGFAAFALGLAALAVLAAVAYSQLSTAGQAVAPAAGAAPVQHDRGWSSAEGSAGSAWAIAPDSAATDAGRHRSLRSVTVTPEGIKVQVAGGGLLYNGIPYGSFGEATGTGSVQDKLYSEYLRSISAGWGSVGAGGAGGSIRGHLAQ